MNRLLTYGMIGLWCSGYFSHVYAVPEKQGDKINQQQKEIAANIVFELAQQYELGKGVKVNLAQAIHYYEQAIQQGSQKAREALAELYLIKSKEPNRYNKAIELYQQAPEELCQKAYARIGDIYYEGGYGVEQDQEGAMVWYAKAVKHGNGLAAMKLGHAYQMGRLNEGCNFLKAFDYYKEAAVLGLNAHGYIAKIYRCGWDKRFEIDFKGAEQHYMKALEVIKQGKPVLYGLADVFPRYVGYEYNYNYVEDRTPEELYKQGDATIVYGWLGALYELGNDEQFPKDYQQAIVWYTKDAEQGNQLAAEKIASLYRNGGYGIAIDHRKTAYWLKKALVLGSDTQYELGRLYERGEYGLEKDILTAKKYFEEYTQTRWVDSSTFQWLGDIYRYGDHSEIEKNYTKAVEWYLKGIDNNTRRNHPVRYIDQLILSVAEIYQEGGYGIEKDYTQVKKYYEMSFDAGSSEACLRLAKIYEEGGYGIDRNYKQALGWYEHAIKMRKYTFLEIARLYEEGGYGLEKNSEKAREYRMMEERRKEIEKILKGFESE